MSDDPNAVDLSGMHGEIDRLKVQLCRCQHKGECLACQGFEVVRQQTQAVVAAASQPVLMQVAQEAAAKDLMQQLGGLQEKLVDDPRLQELFAEVMSRIQDDLGGPEAMQKMFGEMGMFPGSGDRPIPLEDRGPSSTGQKTPFDDKPAPDPKANSDDKPDADDQISPDNPRSTNLD